MNAHEAKPGQDTSNENPFEKGMKIRLNNGDGLLLPFDRHSSLNLDAEKVLTVRIDLKEGDSLIFKDGEARLISGDRPYPVFNDFKVKNSRLTYKLPGCGEVDKTNRCLVFKDMSNTGHVYHMEMLHRDPKGHALDKTANLFGCVVAVPDPNDPQRMFNGTGGWGGNAGGILADPASN